MNDAVARYEIQSMKYIKYEIPRHNVLATYNVTHQADDARLSDNN